MASILTQIYGSRIGLGPNDELILNGIVIADTDSLGNLTMTPTNSLAVEASFLTLGNGGGVRVIREVADQFTYYCGSDGSTTGAALLLYGGSHNSEPSVAQLRQDNVIVWRLDDGGGDEDLIWNDNAGSEMMRFDRASGRVGIGESAPDYLLDVNGTFGITPGASVTPVDNGDIVFEFTNDTTVTIRGKGSDGTVRAGTVTLS